jgi:hypothetical protein
VESSTTSEAMPRHQCKKGSSPTILVTCKALFSTILLAWLMHESGRQYDLKP